MYWTSIKNNKLKEENDRINLVISVCFNSSRRNLLADVTFRGCKLLVDITFHVTVMM